MPKDVNFMVTVKKTGILGTALDAYLKQLRIIIYVNLGIAMVCAKTLPKNNTTKFLDLPVVVSHVKIQCLTPSNNLRALSILDQITKRL